ncbi:MAG: hypothetical protein LBL46_04860 [Rickettsiales bacterium]|nr:hypothetical protein [Rickettsiales bacterium]
MNKMLCAIALFLAMQGADAAKMCVRNLNPSSKWLANSTAGLWANGPGCTAGSFGNGVETTTETNINNFCGGNIRLHGIAKSVYAYDALFNDVNTIDSIAANTDQSKNGCFCKIKYPFESNWIPLPGLQGATTGECAGYCANSSRFNWMQKMITRGGKD